MTTTMIGLLLAAFLVLNLLFYFALQGPTSKGRKILAQIDDYKKFLSQVDADEISRVRSAGRVPDQLEAKDAYAIAFHIDLGWGEQFVTSIAGVIECAELFDNVKDDDRPALLKI